MQRTGRRPSLRAPNTGGLATGDVTVLFSDFVTGGEAPADFTQVGAVQIQINATDGLDVQLDQFEAFGPINQLTIFRTRPCRRSRWMTLRSPKGTKGLLDAGMTYAFQPLHAVRANYGTADGPASAVPLIRSPAPAW